MNKMESQEYTVGLDIGTTKIVAMMGRKMKYGKLILRCGARYKSLGVHRGVINNITETITSTQQAVATEAVSGMQMTVGIAGQHIRGLPFSYITRGDKGETVINQEDITKLCNQVFKLVMLPG
jgi:cell division protein FtsA